MACILSLSCSEVAAAESALRVASDLAQQQLSLDTSALAGMTITAMPIIVRLPWLSKRVSTIY